MNDFDYDSLQKKKLARQVYHRKGTRGRKSITLRQDHMTASQLRKENGPLMEYKLNAPMKWKQFRAMPDDIQQTYINLLREKYCASNKALAEMLDVSVKTLNLFYPAGGYHRANDEQRNAWRRFLDGNSVTEIENDGVEEPDDEIDEEPIVEEPAEEENDAWKLIDAPAIKSTVGIKSKPLQEHLRFKANAESMSMTLCGSADELLASLRMAFAALNHGEDDTYTCTISVEKVF